MSRGSADWRRSEHRRREIRREILHRLEIALFRERVPRGGEPHSRVPLQSALRSSPSIGVRADRPDPPGAKPVVPIVPQLPSARCVPCKCASPLSIASCTSLRIEASFSRRTRLRTPRPAEGRPGHARETERARRMEFKHKRPRQLSRSGIPLGILFPVCGPKHRRMELETLQDLYITELKDLYSAEKKLIKALPKMAKAATNARPRRRLQAAPRGDQGTGGPAGKILKSHDETTRGPKCKGMEGVLAEGDEMIEEEAETTSARCRTAIRYRSKGRHT